MITQSKYKEFKDDTDALIREYNGKFPIPVIMDWKACERTYVINMFGMFREIMENLTVLMIGERMYYGQLGRSQKGMKLKKKGGQFRTGDFEQFLDGV